ncbi:MAG: hypothetical protein R3E32_07590 [Chitinophagales bacterium]
MKNKLPLISIPITIIMCILAIFAFMRNQPNFSPIIRNLDDENWEIVIENITPNIYIENVYCTFPSAFMEAKYKTNYEMTKTDNQFTLNINFLERIIKKKKDNYPNGFTPICIPIYLNIRYIEGGRFGFFSSSYKLKSCVHRFEKDDINDIKLIVLKNAITLIEKHNGKNIEQKLNELYHEIYNCENNKCGSNQ